MNVTTLLPAVMLSLVAALPVAAEKAFDGYEVADTEAVRCISLTRIRSTEVIDEKHIVFYMTGRQQYLNTLPHKCSGLNRRKTIMYRTSLSVLCDLDIITVLDNIGGGFQPGPSCGLGRFAPVSTQEISVLKELIKAEKEGLRR